jgi:hypothetical protein
MRDDGALRLLFLDQLSNVLLVAGSRGEHERHAGALVFGQSHCARLEGCGVAGLIEPDLIRTPSLYDVLSFVCFVLIRTQGLERLMLG